MLTLAAFAQLPKIEVVHARGRNIVSWLNTYQGLSSIVIQRSSDSIRGFVNVGSLSKPAKGANAWSDDKPLVGNNYYQLVINFNEDVNWPSDIKGIVLDSSMVAAGKNIDIEVAKNAAAEKAKITNPDLIKKDEVVPEFVFQPSIHVYTNNYTGHVNVTLENALSKRYSLVFYYPDKKEAFKIERISIDHVTIDKHNFNGRGIFGFTLFESGNATESGFVQIK